ncbi:uncharacterized protein L3040_005938 [Drepanopeziza brunnea f. sp. 'multigermtubi']|uniref:uncharacterized protein n=1 Tax=Drepanopeziza brunnea f. sp. 'multigermtubi' TaxID=698441 RepID=UPI00239B2F44|nr:hypothetical protein L3040_005938 [Drepanopeziza brunnea f. sp. 'multigermtubi']
MFQPQATPIFTTYGVNANVNAHAQPPNLGVVGVDIAPTASSDRFVPIATNASNHQHHYHPHNYQKMDNDIAAQEALAREYNPVLEGQLVGEKKSSLAITAEYAKADPIYVAKTTVLPQKYSHYRPVLGDGNCGWRAAGYSYFETLLRLQDRNRFEEEIARMISLNNLLTTAGGFASWLFEDMVEQTTDLLRDMAELVESSPQDAGELLRQRFNDASISNSMIYHLRLLASSWFKANVSLYEGFIPDNHGVEGYPKNILEPVDTEIDHLGMTLLIDVLLKPIGVSVEIVYLDRSPGSQANTHLFQSLDANGNATNPHGPMIHLLFRPNHYDILYKDQGSTTIPAVQEAMRNHTNIQVNRATNFSQHQPFQSTPASSMGGYSQMDQMSLLSCIPGFSLAPQPSHHGFPSQLSSRIDHYPPSSSPISASMSPISPAASLAAATSSNALPTSFPVQPQPPPPTTSLSTPQAPLASPHPHLAFPNTTTQLPILTHLPPSLPQRRSISSHPSLSTNSSLGGSELSSPPSSAAMTSFRPSKYELESAADWEEGPVVFQTSTFKNSHYNTAHYNNPNFQPEEWTPECEEALVRKRSS